MIKSFEVTNLNKRNADFRHSFHSDINVVTGLNGSGKTSLLKLIWYALSGHLEQIPLEIPFDSFELVTDSFTVGMEQNQDEKRMRRVDFIWEGKRHSRTAERLSELQVVQEANKAIASAPGGSIFFPTFRRFEGGFGTSKAEERPVRYRQQMWRGSEYLFVDPGGLAQGLAQLSDRWTNRAHRFVSSISTADINQLVTSKYAEISERTNRLHMSFAHEMLSRARSAGSGNDSGIATEPAAGEALDAIYEKAKNVIAESDKLLRPITVLSELVSQVLKYNGIKLGGSVALGEVVDAISSDLLSAGEKQMLSFLCYNAFAEKACIFIDEPEISLHTDWQRILFKVLLEQSTGNQFIVATHSPFIYSKYSDKELLMAEHRGDVEDEGKGGPDGN
ncbi:MAG: AAA family ATPase [Planctomycetaceae bacterium]|nr:AAA family ATPase [Planctomycetaceae bacterium]